MDYCRFVDDLEFKNKVRKTGETILLACEYWLVTGSDEFISVYFSHNIYFSKQHSNNVSRICWTRFDATLFKDNRTPNSDEYILDPLGPISHILHT